jgi:hypothetical protein
MTLEQAIQQRWADDVTLAALVPSERVFTSFAPAEAARPRVVVERRKSVPKLRSSSGLRAEAVELVFVVEAESYDVAASIAAGVAEAFDEADFEAGEGRVAAMRRGEELRERKAGDVAEREFVRWELKYEVVLCGS